MIGEAASVISARAFEREKLEETCTSVEYTTWLVLLSTYFESLYRY